MVFREMSSEKGETKKKKGLTWAEAAKQVSCNGDTMNPMSADSRLCDLLSVVIIVNSVILSLCLGTREVCRASHSQRYSQGYTGGRFARFKVSIPVVAFLAQRDLSYGFI